MKRIPQKPTFSSRCTLVHAIPMQEWGTSIMPLWVLQCRDVPRAQISPDYNMIKQLRIKCIYDKIHSRCEPNRATSPTRLRCDVTHTCLMGIEVLYIPSWKVGKHEKRRHPRKTVCSVKTLYVLNVSRGGVWNPSSSKTGTYLPII